MRPALQAVDQWAEDHLLKVCASKTEALVISLDPRETAGKAKPPLRPAGDTVKYSSDLQRKGPEILGITFDSQLRFTEQTVTACSKLKSRTKIIQAVAGTDWGMQGSVFRHLFNAYARPGGLYAAGVWYSFTSQTNRDKLESLNYQVARIITGAPKVRMLQKLAAKLSFHRSFMLPKRNQPGSSTRSKTWTRATTSHT